MPGAVCLLLTPALMYLVYPPEVKDTPDAPAKVRRSPLLTPVLSGGQGGARVGPAEAFQRAAVAGILSFRKTARWRSNPPPTLLHSITSVFTASPF